VSLPLAHSNLGPAQQRNETTLLHSRPVFIDAEYALSSVPQKPIGSSRAACCNRRQSVPPSHFSRAHSVPPSAPVPQLQLPWRRRDPWRAKRRPCCGPGSATHPSSTPPSGRPRTPTTGEPNRRPSASIPTTPALSVNSFTNQNLFGSGSKLKYLVASSVSEACNNSVLLLGPRGCGKAAVRRFFPFPDPPARSRDA
jgi:hypothetical protein